MLKPKVEVGQKFGRWTVVEDLGIKNINGTGHYCVLVKCECGKMREHLLYVLNCGRSTSCGCFRKESQSTRGKTFFTHNLSKHPLYSIWMGIKYRCYNKNCKQYKDYGGRGIKMCKEWRHNFKAFYDWAIKNGWGLGLSIDRKENDGDYLPDNCRFVTPKISMRNTRRNNLIEFNGRSLCITDWANEIGITPSGLFGRLKRWDIQKALTTPKIIWH